MNSRRHLLSIAAAAVLFFAPALLVARQDPAGRLRLAQQLEASGQYERARPIYESLADSNPTNLVYFEGLRRVYIELKEFDLAIALVKRRLVMQPRDPALLTSLGALFYQAGHEQRADSLWNAVLELNPMNPAVYRLVANQLIEFRLYEEAAAIYRRARDATGTPDIFGQELALIYGALQQYNAAVAEYVQLVKRNPMQLPLVQSKISSFSLTGEALQGAFTVVRDAVDDDPQNPSLRMLLVSLAVEARQYDVALEEVRLVDRLKKANGAELYSFAQHALRDGAYAQADQAYQDIIEQHPTIALVPYAKLGRIRTAEERLSDVDSTAFLDPDERLVTSRTSISWPVRESISGWNQVIAMYEQLAAEYSHTTIAAQSLFRVGTIAFEKLFDLDRALAAFARVETMKEGGDLMVYARLNSARILMAQNNLAKARSIYEGLQTSSVQPVRSSAAFELAELDYFETHFDTARVAFEALGADLQNDEANDALKYLYFIQENQSSAPAALSAFARADLLVRQRKYSEALERFGHLCASNRTALLADVATLRYGELCLALGRADSAVAAFRFVADSLSTSIVRDRALLLAAQTVERVRHDDHGALAIYEELLERFPGSIYAQAARQRIRILRGDLP